MMFFSLSVATIIKAVSSESCERWTWEATIHKVIWSPNHRILHSKQTCATIESLQWLSPFVRWQSACFIIVKISPNYSSISDEHRIFFVYHRSEWFPRWCFSAETAKNHLRKEQWSCDFKQNFIIKKSATVKLWCKASWKSQQNYMNYQWPPR